MFKTLAYILRIPVYRGENMEIRYIDPSDDKEKSALEIYKQASALRKIAYKSDYSGVTMWLYLLSCNGLSHSSAVRSPYAPPILSRVLRHSFFMQALQ